MAQVAAAATSFKDPEMPTAPAAAEATCAAASRAAALLDPKRSHRTQQPRALP